MSVKVADIHMHLPLVYIYIYHYMTNLILNTFSSRKAACHYVA
jgi:hypothetical protein